MEKTKVSMEEVEHVANLSRLTFNDDEKRLFNRIFLKL